MPESTEAGVNWALSANVRRASASSEQLGPPHHCPASGVIDGVRDDLGWSAGHGWASEFGQPLPQWLEVRFPGPRTIGQFAVATFQTQVGPEDAAKWGGKDYVVKIWDESTGSWKVVVEENRGRTMKNRHHLLVEPVRSDRFRVVISRVAPADGIARLLQVEAWGDARR